MRKILPFFMSTLLVIFVASYWVLNYTGNNADLADGKTYVITVENGMTAADRKIKRRNYRYSGARAG